MEGNKRNLQILDCLKISPARACLWMSSDRTEILKKEIGKESGSYYIPIEVFDCLNFEAR